MPACAAMIGMTGDCICIQRARAWTDGAKLRRTSIVGPGSFVTVLVYNTQHSLYFSCKTLSTSRKYAAKIAI